MGTGLYSTVCCHGDHIDLAILCREQYDNAFTKLILELVTQVSQAIHIHTVYAGCQKLCSLDFHCLIHDIAQCGLCHLGFQGLVLSIQSLQFCLHMLDLLGQGCRSCLCGCGCLIEVLFHSLIVCHHVGTGQCFDSSDAGSDTALGQDLEVTDLTGMLYMTEEAKQAYQKMMSEERRRSDEAWAKALPVVQKEAREGRPYISWASRPYDLPQARIPAFPGAEGGGMYSFGGRGGKVITVTNLNDRGPGSFREACETGGARIIVFNVSGIIKLESPIIVRAPYVTIAGQTAPGDGVCIAGESFWVNTHDVVVRHMRFRRGETKVWHRDDSFGGNPIGNIMIDHCSCTWGLDENISFYRHMYDPSEGQYESKDLKLPTVNVTIQNTISAKALDTYNHAFGSTLGGENCAFMRNLWASNSGRNPSVGWNGVFNFVNNVVFNWVHRSSDGGDYTAMFNMINNYYKPGPATPKDTPVGHRILKPEAGRSKLDHKVYGRVYADGNIMEGYPAITEDNWAGGIQIETQPNTDGYTENMRSNRPFEMPYIRITSAHDAYDFVLKNAGANIPCRDIVDERIVEEVRTGVPYYDKKMAKDANGDLTGLAPKSMGEDGQFKYRRLPKDSYKQGIITDIRQMGGYPEYKGTPYVDTDGDGMPDEWEKANGLNPNDPSDANKDCTGDGYTNIEKYINGISTRNCIDWSDLRNNYDTLASKGKLM